MAAFRPALLCLFVLVATGCSEDNRPSLPLGPRSELAGTTVAALDSLVGEEVSINGRVLEQTAGDRTLLLDDGTGLVHVRTPEPLPVIVGERLFVQGTLREDDGRPLLDADEWLYDSTAVSVRSE